MRMKLGQGGFAHKTINDPVSRVVTRVVISMRVPAGSPPAGTPA